jgi:hypothetical protein
MPAIVDPPVDAFGSPTVGVRVGDVADVVAARVVIARLAGVGPGASGSRLRRGDLPSASAPVTR